MQSQASNGGIGGAVREISEHAASLAKLEIQLAKIELARKASKLAVAGGFGIGAAILLLFGLGFALGAAVVGLDLVLPLWLSFLVVAAAVAVVSAAFGLLAYAAARRAVPPVPEQAIDEAKETTRVLRHANAR
jgi:hypothetical protein